MKKFFLIFLNVIFYHAFSQTHKAVYSVKIEANPITGDTSFGDEVNPLLENNEFYLYFDNERSYYTSENVENNVKDMSDAIGMSYYPIKYSFQQNSFQRDVQIDKIYSYTSNNEVVWTLTEETKEIAGYTCIKAIGVQTDVTDNSKKYHFEAWFAPEVAYPIGPADYAGLPGIIVYLVYENYFIYKLESIKFNDNSLDINSIKYKGDQLTKEQYIEYLKS